MAAESDPSQISRAFNIVSELVIPRTPDRPLVHPIGEYAEGEALEDYVVFFAGHGAPQVAGMEKSLRQIAQVENGYNSLETSLGYDMRSLTNDDLKETKYAQPIIASVNTFSALVHEHANPDELKNTPYAVSGQSAGLLSAAWFAGIYGPRNTKDAVMLTIETAALRGEIMQQMKDNPPSGHMLISVGDRKTRATDEERQIIDTIRRDSLQRENAVSLAIDISDGRIILGGETSDLKEAHQFLKDAYKGYNIHFYDVPTSCVGFHGNVMKPVEGQVRDLFEQQRKFMKPPQVPILSNTYQEPRLITTIDEYIAEQVRLVTHPVFGRDMNKFLEDKGIDTGIEFGERGIIAKSMDGFDITPRKVALAGSVLAAGVAATIGTGYLVKRSGKN